MFIFSMNDFKKLKQIYANSINGFQFQFFFMYRYHDIYIITADTYDNMSTIINDTRWIELLRREN